MPSTAFAASVAVPVHGLHLCRRVAKRLRGSLERPVTSGCDGAMPLEVVRGGVCGSGSGRSIAAMSAVDGWLGWVDGIERSLNGIAAKRKSSDRHLPVGAFSFEPSRDQIRCTSAACGPF